MPKEMLSRHQRAFSRSRVHTRVACTTCKAAKVRCEGTRPCKYCVKHQCADACVDSLQKKRGPKPKSYLGEGGVVSEVKKTEKTLRPKTLVSRGLSAQQRQAQQNQLRMLPTAAIPVHLPGPGPTLLVPSSLSSGAPTFTINPTTGSLSMSMSMPMPSLSSLSPSDSGSQGVVSPSGGSSSQSQSNSNSNGKGMSVTTATALPSPFPMVYSFTPTMMCPMPFPAYFSAPPFPQMSQLGVGGSYYPYFSVSTGPNGAVLPVVSMTQSAPPSSVDSKLSSSSSMSMPHVHADAVSSLSDNEKAEALGVNRSYSPTQLARSFSEKTNITDSVDNSTTISSTASVVSVTSAGSGSGGSVHPLPGSSLASLASDIEVDSLDAHSTAASYGSGTTTNSNGTTFKNQNQSQGQGQGSSTSSIFSSASASAFGRPAKPVRASSTSSLPGTNLLAS